MNSYLVIGGDLNQRIDKILSIIAEKQNLSKNKVQLSKKNKLISKNSPDVFFVEAQLSIGILKVRQIQKFLSRKPYGHSFNFVILKEAEKLTIPAQNAFLKTLEEVSENSYIFLSCQNQDQLLTTIISRCQIIRLDKVGEFKLDQKTLTTYYSLLTKILNSRIGERLKLIEPYAKSREEAIEFLENIICAIHLYIKNNKYQSHYKISEFKLPNLARSFQKTLNLLNANVNVKLALDNLVIDLN